MHKVKRYASPSDAFRKIWIEEGPRAFTRGLSVRLLYITPSAAVSFAFYEYFKTIFVAWRSGVSFALPKKPKPNADGVEQESGDASSSGLTIFHPLAPLFAGAMARLVGTACRTPFDIVKSRLQVC
jgi:hypothetical protein